MRNIWKGLSMDKRVVIMKCDSYEDEEVYRALSKAFEILNVLENQWIINANIVLKPNLCLPSLPEKQLTTNPQVIRQLIRIFQKKNSSIKVGDTSIGYTDNDRSSRVWEMTGMNVILQEYGIEKIDMQKDISFAAVKIDGETVTLPIANEVLQANIINVPKLKTHSYMLLTGCVKNLYGILAGDAKKRYHKVMATKEKFAKLLLEINNLVNNKLNVVDAVWGIEGEGPGAKGKARHIGVIVVGYDAVMVDKTLAQIVNLNSNDVLTNYFGSSAEPIILGEDINRIKLFDYELPYICCKNDRIIEHVIEAKTSYAEINKEKCKGCGMCFSNCPALAIHEAEGKYQISKKTCISCFVCMEVCPYSAIMLKNSEFIKNINLKYRGYANERNNI